MKFEVVKWAWDCDIFCEGYKPVSKPSSIKLVLVLMASHADAMDCFGRTRDYVETKTELNRKTLISVMKDLIGLGLIVDTGKRCGSSKRTKIYQLDVTNSHQEDEDNVCHKSSVIGADSPKKLSTDSTENGTFKKSQKRDDVNLNSPKSGMIKKSQKRYSVLYNLLYIKNKPRLNLKAYELWITHLHDNFFDEFLTADPVHLIDVQITFGDFDNQMKIVSNAKRKNWKHLHAISKADLKKTTPLNAKAALQNIKNQAGLYC